MSTFDFSELTDFEEELLQLASEFKDGKEAKKFLGKAGTKLKNVTVRIAKSRVKKVTGNLFRGIARGKPYKYYIDGSMAVRVYGKSPHTHLLNNGHRVVDRKGKEQGFAPGYHFMEDGADTYKEQFNEDILGFLDDMLDNHGL